MFQKLLIANRGEIAVRILAAARTLAIPTVAVHSDADACAMHVRHADESIRIGPAPASQSYLDIEAIVAAAKTCGADAVHPGYGFLSESAQFAEAIAAAGITFIGPPPDVMALMGDKLQARKAAVAAGLPVLAGSEQVPDNLDGALTLVERLGFPVVVKARHGGGGRGMRIVHDAAALKTAIQSAKREAAAAFGRDEVFIERYLARPRHVEVQVLGDENGTLVHLGDRDCSVQRRHQKMLEEAPAPDLPPHLRSAICDAAISLARSVGYVGAGTVEFLMERDSEAFYFLEMNTRLQVEHGVSEMITGVDLVEQQIRIAAGRPLSLTQDELGFRGHAMEARILAEDPWDDFRPDPGHIDHLSLPDGPWTRRDFGVEAGDFVQPYYDSMIGKLLVWAPDRNAAIARLEQGLAQFRVRGISTNALYLRQLVREPAFGSCRHHTGSVETDWLPAPGGRPSSLAAQQEIDAIAPDVTERLVTLPGLPPRTIAIYGRSRQTGPVARTGPHAHDLRCEAVERAPRTSTNDGSVTAPMDGVLVNLHVQSGQTVEEGDPLAILEAMKMEVVLSAPKKGVVGKAALCAGTPVTKGQLVMIVE